MKINPYIPKTESSQNKQSFKAVMLNDALGAIGNFASSHVSTPEQKLLTANTALVLQPMIDLKYAKEDKKVDSAIKSASKAMAGGFTGVLIRTAFINLTSSLIDFNKKNIVSKLLFPPAAKKELETNAQEAMLKLKSYNKSIGSIIAVAFMVLFSNSKVDVPITSDLQDIISGVVKEDKTWFTSICEVAKSRKNKIQTKLKQWTGISKNKMEEEIK